MTPHSLFIAILGITLVNGFVSPAVPMVFFWAPVWLPEFAPKTPETILYGTSLMVSLATLVLSGVPAALYERLTGRQETDMSSMWVWLISALLLTAPGLI